MAPAPRFPRPAGPPPGRDGAAPGSPAPAQLTRPLSPRLLLPRRAGPCRRHVGPLRALGTRSQRPALGRQRLLQPPKPALQRGHPEDLRGQRVSVPRGPAPPPRPPTAASGGPRETRVGGSRARPSLPAQPRGWERAGVGVHPRAWTPARSFHVIVALGAPGVPALGMGSALGGVGYHVPLTGGPQSPGPSPARASCDSCLVLQ